MAEMFLWAAASGFALFTYGLSKRLGLLDTVPRDPKARVASYASSVLLVVKDQLVGSQLEEWEPGRVSYVKGAHRGCLWAAEGVLHYEHDTEKEDFPLGDRGSLVFQLEGNQMSVGILAAETGGPEHNANVSIRMLVKTG